MISSRKHNHAARQKQPSSMADRLPTIGTWLDPVEVAQFEDSQRTGTESGHYDLALPDRRRFAKVYDTVIDQFNASIEEISVKIELTEHASAVAF